MSINHHINKMKEFIEKYPLLNELVNIDNYDIDPVSYGLFYNGQQIINETKDVLGNKLINKRISFVFYVIDVTMDNYMRLDNIGFLDELIEWIENSKEKPIFGDRPNEEVYELSNNMLFRDDNKIGTYQLQINVTFYKEVKNG